MRYEASQFGSPYIETEHLLLGLLREDKALAMRFLRSEKPIEDIRNQVENYTLAREKTPTSIDLPLSSECKRVLADAAEEAEGLGHKHIGPEHLLLGMLREEQGFAARILMERGLRLQAVREEIAQYPAGESTYRVSSIPPGPLLKVELMVEGTVVASLVIQTYALPRTGDVFVFAKVSYKIIEVRFIYEEALSRVDKIQIIGQ